MLMKIMKMLEKSDAQVEENGVSGRTRGTFSGPNGFLSSRFFCLACIESGKQTR